MEQTFLGTGVTFPIQIDPATGRFKMSAGKQSVKESVYLILMTQVTERLTRPSFGTRSASYVFMDMNLTELTIMKRELEESVLTQEPRISDVNITTEMQAQQGYILINIDYTLAETNQTDNMVFPFYMNAEPEPSEEEEYYEPLIIDMEE
ncbi:MULTISPECIES: GPW/gp25 family protein [unclassified Butyrivibrio]|uniref:GPW/gp25 family protein n=1 Tax=unclassified Butyrivibrio TaxID=2639466 RepID=UPI0003B64EDA|nr:MULTISPECIES: GPW/gp25 family protein [unclassified Butyrivibrio]MDC7295055.1 GPW/gp25 family protein [Butyrivibrio sp. DSM 10294]